jgi:thiol-disulfide isomerase/thioredoxin
MATGAKLVHAPDIGVTWRGRVTLVDFWDYTCVNCIRTLPYIVEWSRRYAEKGLVVIGVHAPEFAFARDRSNVDAAAREFGIAYQVVLDNDHRIWRAFANRYWPAVYLVDGEGYVRFQHAGEGEYSLIEQAIQELLRELDPSVELPPLMEPLRALDRPGILQVCERPTPELHLGAGSAQPGNLEFEGPWRHEPDCAVVAGSPSRLRLRYFGAEVNLVMAPGPSPAILEVLDEGAPVDHQSRGADVKEAPDGRTLAAIEHPRMYRLIQRDRFLTRTLELSSLSEGLELYAFTFGTCVPRP